MPKTIEGTVWVTAGWQKSPKKLESIPVTLLPPETRDTIKSHLKKLEQYRTSAQEEQMEAAVANAIAAASKDKALAERLSEYIHRQVTEATTNLAVAETLVREGRLEFERAASPLKLRIAELEAEISSAESRVATEEAILAREQALKDTDYNEKKRQLSDNVAAAMVDLESAKSKKHDAHQRVDSLKKQVASMLTSRYAAEKIEVKARIYSECGSCSPKLCIEIRNQGDKALVEFEPQLVINGRDVSSRAMDLFFIGSDWQNIKKDVSVKNEYEENIQGLPPQRTWPDSKRNFDQCRGHSMFLETGRGDGKRAWDSLGGASAKTRVEVRLANVTLADPKLVRSVGKVMKHWEYVPISAEICLGRPSIPIRRLS